MNEEMTVKLAKYMQENGYYDTELIRKDEGQGNHARFWAIFGDDDDQQEPEKSEMLLAAEAHNAAKVESDKESELVSTFTKSDDELTEREWQSLVSNGFAVVVEVEAPADCAAPVTTYRRITPAQGTEARKFWSGLRNTAKRNIRTANRERREAQECKQDHEVRLWFAETEATRKAAHEYAKRKAVLEYNRLKAEYMNNLRAGNATYIAEGVIVAGQGFDTWLYTKNNIVVSGWLRPRFGNTDRVIVDYDGDTVAAIREAGFKLVQFSQSYQELYDDFTREYYSTIKAH